jgi:hypothetical protein
VSFKHSVNEPNSQAPERRCVPYVVQDTGLERQLELVAALQAAGRAPIVVTNDDLIARPEGTLRAICEAVGLQFDPRMLKWDKGGRPEDGVWAAYWCELPVTSQASGPAQVLCMLHREGLRFTVFVGLRRPALP